MTKSKRTHAQNLTLIYLISMGISTAIGGIVGHGLIHYISFAWKLPGWIAGMISVATLERASIVHAKPWLHPKVSTFFSIFNIIELIFFIIASMVFLDFLFVEFHFLYGLLVIIAPFHAYVFFKNRHKSSLWLLASVALSLIAGLIFQMKISPHIWFNHNDLSHVVIGLAILCIYQGTKNFSSS
ncbi:MAG: hypothetical protein KDK51_06005 [Deltaproteobacteria bacterium]|nr:hypothetical protein [Deltaproteobacteria bacterium]